MDSKLVDLSVLAIDCQATGANPDKGHLLEIGWKTHWAGCPKLPDIRDVTTCLLKPPGEGKIPVAVRRLTGITNAMLVDAFPEEQVGLLLDHAVQDTARHNGLELCPAVIHYARYERPFLARLHQLCCPERSFGAQIICTHAIAARLFPDLPRRGIRALAGFLGHSTPELKRSADHVLATLFIWKKLVTLLDSRCNISTLSQLRQWLTATPAAARTKLHYPMKPEVRLNLPDRPGVYFMQRANRDILYVGKAKSLKKRVNSYFRGKGHHAEHLLEMLSQARNLDYCETDTALAAAVLESDEIKRLAPPYNIALRSGERQLVFLSSDFEACSDCEGSYGVGPIPGGRHVAGLAALFRWCGQELFFPEDEIAKVGDLLLGYGPGHGPALDVIGEGLALFRQLYGGQFHDASTLRFVTRLGAQLWRRDRLTQEDASAADTEADGIDSVDPDPAPGRQWTSEGVMRHVEHLISGAAFLIRRARWFVILSEAALAWSGADDPSGLQHVVVFEKGAMSCPPGRPTVAQVPIPPGYNRPFSARRRQMDLSVYDRMRVVTTELRRLIREDRQVVLRLGRSAILSREALAKVLRWV